MKYRIWDKKQKKFITTLKDRIGRESLLLLNSNGELVLAFDGFMSNDVSKTFFGEYLKNYLIIQKFTGLKDKNKIDIFEGDCLLDYRNKKFEVVWLDYKWDLRIIPYTNMFYSTNEDHFYDIQDMEIYGNIKQIQNEK